MNSHLLYKRYSDVLVDELKAILEGDNDFLYSMMRYQMGFEDYSNVRRIDLNSNHITPIICLLTCELLAGDYRSAISAAVALELIHQFMVAHNDVFSGSTLEESEKSVNKKWGFGQAINVGDGFHALGRSSLFRLVENKISIGDTIVALRLLDEACIEMCEGQYLDLAARGKFDITKAAYLKVAEFKSGSIMGCSMGLGAISALAEDNIVQALKLSGQNFGVAYQIANDILKIKSCEVDLTLAQWYLRDRHLFPCVVMLEDLGISKQREFRSLYSKTSLDSRDVIQMLKLINDNNAIQIAQKEAQSRVNNGIGILKKSQLSNDTIRRFVDEVIPLIMQ